MLQNDPNRDWEKWGNTNPYFAVLTHPQYSSGSLNDRALDEFFLSGSQHVSHIHDVLKTNLGLRGEPVRVLDYGCGVGRLVIPFAQRARDVTGVDVSRSMLKIARENCERFGCSNVQLIGVEEFHALKPESFDLIHSFIVFQHIPVERGMGIVRELVKLLAKNGAGALHFTYSDNRARLHRWALACRQRVRLIHGLLNLTQHRPFSTPLMQMNSYSLAGILNLLVDAGCGNFHVEISDHAGFRGAMIYFEKSATSPL